MGRRKIDQPDGVGLSPLARRLLAMQGDGLSFREMERIAYGHGIRYSSSAFEQVAKDQRAGRLDPDALRAVALVLNLTPREVADLDDERWGITRQHVAYKDPSNADLTDVPTERLLQEIAARTRTANPEADR